MGCNQSKAAARVELNTDAQKNAVILRHSDFINGPILQQAFKETSLLAKKIDFGGLIQNVQIVKLYKKCRFSILIRIEELVEDKSGDTAAAAVVGYQPGRLVGPRKVFKPIESQINHETDVVKDACHDFKFPDFFHFEHRLSYQDLRNQFLAIYLKEHDSTGQPSLHASQRGDREPVLSNVIAVYRTDLALLAIGPVHHDVELRRASSGCFSNGSHNAARLNVDIKLTQMQKIEVQLDTLKAKIDDKVLKDAYQTGFSVVTQRDVNDSNKSYHCAPDAIKAKSVELDASGHLARSQLTDQPSDAADMLAASSLEWQFSRKEHNAPTSTVFSKVVQPLPAQAQRQSSSAAFIDDILHQPLPGDEAPQITVAHHLDKGDSIFENSVVKNHEDALNAESGGGVAEMLKIGQKHSMSCQMPKDPPYCVFTIHMDNLSDASVRLKIWQDKTFKDQKRRLTSRFVEAFAAKWLSGGPSLQDEKLRSRSFRDSLPQLRKNLSAIAPAELGPAVQVSAATQSNDKRRSDEILNVDLIKVQQKVLVDEETVPDGLDSDRMIQLNDVEVSFQKEEESSPVKIDLIKNASTEEPTGGEQAPPRKRPHKLLSQTTPQHSAPNLLAVPELGRRTMDFDAQSQVSYKIVQGAKARGDALDIYGFDSKSPYFKSKKGKQADSSGSDTISNEGASDKGSADSHRVQIAEDEELVGECHIAFEKLLSSLFQFQARKNQNMFSHDEIRKQVSGVDPAESLRKSKVQALQKKILQFQQLVDFEERLWLRGQQIGTIEGSLRFINFPFLEQMPIGVIQNQGIQFSSRPLLNADGAGFKKSKIGQHPKFQAIVQEKTRLVRNDKNEISLEFGETIRTADKLIEALTFSEKTSMTSFIYNSEADMMRAQSLFIDIGEHMLEFLDYVNQFLREKYYTILVKVLNRSELDLGQMQAVKESFSNKKFLATKSALISAYQRFIYRVLKAGISVMRTKGIEPSKREFVCTAITIGYFRVTPFRAIFLSQVQDKSSRVGKAVAENSHQPQLITTDEVVNSAVPHVPDAKSLNKFFDWDSYCFGLIDEAEAGVNYKIIESYLQPVGTGSGGAEQKWAERIRNRGQTFFMIIQTWVRHIRRVLFIENGITWGDIPGYKEIVRALVEELKARNVVEYPDSLTEAVKSFLSNSKLLNGVIKVTFSKTSIFDYRAVKHTMEHTAKWFLKLHARRVTIPSDFDWSFFMTGIAKMLSLDHSLSTSRGIWLLYQIIHTFPSLERDRLLASILQPQTFYRLFFHWSWDVRKSFHYFFYFQLHRIFLDSQSTANEMHQSIVASLADLGLEAKAGDSAAAEEGATSIKKSKKQAIPLHEDLPKAEFEVKEDPVPLAELKFVDMMGSSRGSIHGTSPPNRLMGLKNQGLHDAFKERLEEINTLRLLCKSIKTFIKRHKPQLLDQQKSNAPILTKMRKQLNRLRETEEGESESAVAQGEDVVGASPQSLKESSARSVGGRSRSAAGDTDLESIKQRKALKKRLDHFNNQASFNFENFANATDDILTEQIVQGEPDSPIARKLPSGSLDFVTTSVLKKPKYILTESQRRRWNQIIENVPAPYRVYIQPSFRQLKVAQRDYQDWVQQQADDDIHKMMKSEQSGDLKQKMKPFSDQGFEGKPDFPKVDVHVPEDRREMDTGDQDW